MDTGFPRRGERRDRADRRAGAERRSAERRRRSNPLALEKVLRKATAMDPGGRYTTAAGFRKALDRSMRKSTETPAPSDEGGPITRLLRKL